MASIPRTSVSFCVVFSFIRPAHSEAHSYKKKNTEMFATEIDNFLCFIFVFLFKEKSECT